jgi:hypothetical protein
MGSVMTSAYVTTVGSDRIIKLPPEMPAGTTVAVIAVPSGTSEQGDVERHARFAATLAAIRAASRPESPKATVSDEELTVLVERARKAQA